MSQTPAPTLDMTAVTPAADVREADRALRRLASIELWERFSYYILTGLLALYLAAPVAEGGAGWAPEDALRFYGFYLACITIAPFFGGLVSDRWLGGASALFAGAWMMLAGHGLLGLAGLQAGVSIAFYTGLALVALGNGLFKPNISVLVGRLPHDSQSARDAAFGTFWMFINIGGLLATMGGGLLAQRLSWHWAFGAAGLGMVIALALMALFHRRVIAPYATVPERRRDARSPVDWAFLTPVGIILAIIILFGVAYYQVFGALSLFTDSRVDRLIFGFEVPTVWFLSLNPFFMLMLVPLISRGWRYGRGIGHDWPTTRKLAAGFVLVAASFVLMLGAIVQAQSGLASPLWIVGAILVLTLAELMTGPIALAAVSRLSPAPVANIAMGGYSAAIGIGGLLSGQVGALAMKDGMLAVFGAIAGGAMLVAAALHLARARLQRLGI
ncbi:peptide MFS transporter [Blastomonas fulva]|jgi:POT family proton-dependent oligopeptide transporter|uniref:peptide MFS transporter n=1 Tax=Blastomonas fulva TaxID=1550728 RepID=UPI003D28D5CE